MLTKYSGTFLKPSAARSIGTEFSAMSNESPLVKLLGPSLLSKVGQKVSTKDAFLDKELVILYFSASWCPPCQGFTPILVQFYNKCAKEGKLDIVFVSSDRTVESFEGYYKKMPWLSLPAAEGVANVKNRLAQTFEITGIPTSIVLDVASGQYITDDVRDPVVAAASAGTNDQALQLLQQWKSMPSVPLEEAAQKRKSNVSQRNPLLALIFYILKNPVYIFGLLYIFKQLRKQLANSFSNSGETGEEL